MQRLYVLTLIVSCAVGIGRFSNDSERIVEIGLDEHDVQLGSRVVIDPQMLSGDDVPRDIVATFDSMSGGLVLADGSVRILVQLPETDGDVLSCTAAPWGMSRDFGWVCIVESKSVDGRFCYRLVTVWKKDNEKGESSRSETQLLTGFVQGTGVIFESPVRFQVVGLRSEPTGDGIKTAFVYNGVGRGTEIVVYRNACPSVMSLVRFGSFTRFRTKR